MLQHGWHEALVQLVSFYSVHSTYQ